MYAAYKSPRPPVPGERRAVPVGADTLLTQFVNCHLVGEHGLVRDDLWVRAGRILDPQPLFYDEMVVADVQVDCRGSIIAPGFIDLQINGAFGVDFSQTSDNIQAEIKRVAKGLLSHGVTSFCPTVITLPPDDYKKVLPNIHPVEGSKEGAGILGLHLEGPFISREKCGAHPRDYIRHLAGGTAQVEQVYGDLRNAAIVTLAPELVGAQAVIRDLTARGVVVSVGHSMSNLSDGEEAVRCGARLITHLFNAMMPFHHRDPHLVGLLASDVIAPVNNLFYGLIADGVHTHPTALRIARYTHPQGLVLVTDAIPIMGLSGGQHHMGVQLVEVRDGRAYISGTDTLCGSIATMNECVKYFYTATGCSQVEALEAATLHPAQCLGICARKGTLGFNSDADFILLDQSLSVQATFIAGECVWKNPQAKDLTFTPVSN